MLKTRIVENSDWVKKRGQPLCVYPTLPQNGNQSFVQPFHLRAWGREETVLPWSWFFLLIPFFQHRQLKIHFKYNKSMIFMNWCFYLPINVNILIICVSYAEWSSSLSLKLCSGREMLCEYIPPSQKPIFSVSHDKKPSSWKNSKKNCGKFWKLFFFWHYKNKVNIVIVVFYWGRI